MNQNRQREILTDFRHALQRLHEALLAEVGDNDVMIDGAIQRFEFTFELAWKLGKAWLAGEGIEANSPRAVIKAGFKAKLFSDGQAWIDMLEDRNKTAHLYDEEETRHIYEKIKTTHISSLDQLLTKFPSDIKT